jgi:hypothetical protein
MIRRKIRHDFIKNDQAVLGLPLRLTVSMIIGTVALITLLTFILTPCLFPGRTIVSITPMVQSVSGEEPENITFVVYVNGTKGNPVCDASVIIKGLGGAGSGITDNQGKTSIQLQVVLPHNSYEGYLDISVKAPCFQVFEQQDMIKIVKSGY